MQTPIVIIPLDHTTVPVTLVIQEMGKCVQVNEDHVYGQLNFIADSLLYGLRLHNLFVKLHKMFTHTDRIKSNLFVKSFL